MSDLIDEHVAHLRAAGHSEKTIEARVYAIKRLNTALPYGCLFAATEQIEGWLAGLRQKGRSKATIFIYSYHAREFFGWACGAGYLDGNPMADMPRVKKPKCIPKPATDDEATRALDQPEPWRTIGLLATYAGMRCSEIAACQREHITESITYIPRAKGGDPATVPTHPLVWEAVRDRPPGPLVLDRLGREVDGEWVSHATRYRYRRIGLEGVTAHRLRHWYATTLLDNGVDIRVVQELLRHVSIATTMGYTQVTDARRQAAIRLLPTLGHEPGSSRLVP